MTRLEAARLIQSNFPYVSDGDLRDALTMAVNALNENDVLYYKLAGVMHFVDKWLDGDELKLDEVQRADLAREKILKALEERSDDHE